MGDNTTPTQFYYNFYKAHIIMVVHLHPPTLYTVPDSSSILNCFIELTVIYLINIDMDGYAHSPKSIMLRHILFFPVSMHLNIFQRRFTQTIHVEHPSLQNSPMENFYFFFCFVTDLHATNQKKGQKYMQYVCSNTLHTCFLENSATSK